MSDRILDKLVDRVDELLAKAEEVLRTVYTPQHWPTPHVQEGIFHEWQAASLAYLRRVFGAEHTYAETFARQVNENSQSCTVRGQGILRAARDDLLGGHLITLVSLLTADVFGDFLEMAAYLLAEGFKDPAAVMIGSVLEEHLRKLCGAHSVDIVVTDRSGRVVPKKADVMNADLAKAGAYGGIDQKAVTSWLGVRNSAAHGKYSDYSSEQVKLMHDGVLSFLSRLPL